MEKKKISVITVIFVVVIALLIIAIISGMLYYIITLSNEKKEIEGKVESLNNQIAELNNSITDFNNEKDEIVEKFKLPILDSSKVINVENSQEYAVKHIGVLRDYGLWFEWDKGEVSVSIDTGNNMTEQYISSGRISNESELAIGKDKIKVKGLSKKVSDVEFFKVGNGMGDEFIVFLMEDGTCEYAKFNNFIKSAKVDGKVNGLKNIVIIQATSCLPLYNGAYNAGGGYGAIAIDKDGNSYDLDKIINVH